jgi:hypothetical protein
MGYTNYIRQKRDFTDNEWEQLTDEYNYIKEFERISPLDCPDNIIMFNGKNESCETFMLCKNLDDYFNDQHMGDVYKDEYKKQGYHFNFCKTRMFEYDIDVWYLYVVAFSVSKGNIEISRDRG